MQRDIVTWVITGLLVISAWGALPASAHEGEEANTHAHAAEPTETPTTTSFTVAPDVATTIGVTPVRAGDTVKLDLSQISSGTVRIELINEAGQSKKLVETPLLTDSIGLSIKIPTDTSTGRYNLTITGVEKGESIVLPLQVQGTTATKDAANSSQATNFLIWAAVLLMIIITLAVVSRARSDTRVKQK